MADALPFGRIRMSFVRCFGIAAAVTAACALAAPAGAAIIMRKDLSHDMALTAAEGALQACLAKGYATSAVVVEIGRASCRERV